MNGNGAKRTKDPRKRSLNLRLLRETGDRCCFCRCQLNEHSMTREHIVPVSRGGTNSTANLTVSCNDCNQDRGDMEFYAFEARVFKRELYVAPPLKQQINKRQRWLSVKAFQFMARSARR